jgi:hypothetical protein
MDKKIDTLRKFFTISVAAFEMQHTISIAFGFKGHKSYMHMLHLNAKEEIEKEEPDLNKIDTLFAMMEYCADANSKERPTPDKFEKGGV